MKHHVLLSGLLSAGFFLTPVFSANAGKPEPNHVKAIKSCVSQDYSAAMKTAKNTSDPLLVKLTEWFRLTDSKQDIDFRQAENFIKKNPDWPRVYMIRRNAERAVLAKGTPKDIENWFKQHSPVSPQAVLTYAELLLAQKEWEKAIPLLHALWDQGNLTPEETDFVKEKLAFLLDERDFENRIAKLLNERKTAQARKLFSQINDDARHLAQARIALITDASDAKRSLKELSDSQQNDVDLLFDQIHWLRINKKYGAAAKLLEKIPSEKQNSSRWWAEKSALIRQFMAASDYQAAYAIAKNHHLTQGADFADAEWTAGWIALRYLVK